MSAHPSPSDPGVYVDVLGRGWHPDKLAELLSDFAVRRIVQDVFCAAHDAARQFNPGRGYAEALKRYRRKEAAALLFLLVVYHRDHGVPWPRSGGAP